MKTKAGQLHCFYCQDKVERDGVCAGHWEFLFKNMSNRDRMKEKRYHRGMREQEKQRKYEEYLAHKAEATA